MPTQLFAALAAALFAATPALARPIYSATGAEVGALEEHGTALRPAEGAAFAVAPFQHFVGSPDGRTFAAIGQPGMPEHPLVSELRIYRDGVEVARLAEPLHPDAGLTVAHDGRVGLVAHAPDALDAWFAAVWAADGALVARVDLPRGAQGRDPAFVGDALWLRTHGLWTEGVDGGLLEIADGLRQLEVPGALEWLPVAELGAAVVRTADSVQLVDLGSGAVRWRVDEVVRPLGPYAWTWVPAAHALAVVATDVQRRGAPVPPVRVVAFDAGTGDARGSFEVARRGVHPRASAEGSGVRLVWRDGGAALVDLGGVR